MFLNVGIVRDNVLRPGEKSSIFMLLTLIGKWLEKLKQYFPVTGCKREKCLTLWGGVGGLYACLQMGTRG